MYQLIIKARAIEMAKEAWQWYEKEQPGLGDRFLLELEGSYRRIETWPAAYAKIKDGFRQVMLTTFPYVVIFEVIDQDVVVYAVFHTSSNPKWKFRKR